MRILLVGVGTVGESIARLAATHPWCESMVTADYDTARAEALQASLGDASRFPVEHIDAGDRAAVAALARRHRCDLVMNAVDPQFVMSLFEAPSRRRQTTWTWRSASPRRTRPIHSDCRASSLATSSSHETRSGGAPAGLRCWGWAWTPACPTSSPGTPTTTCSTMSTRSTFATAATSPSPATPSPRCSASGPRSRSASIRPSWTRTAAAGSRPSRSARPEAFPFPKASDRRSA